MASVLGSIVVALLLVLGGMWATLRDERNAHKHTRARMSRLEGYVLHLESHERRAAQDMDAPPHAIRFVVVHDESSDVDDRATDHGPPPALDLASMGDDRPTLA